VSSSPRSSPLIILLLISSDVPQSAGSARDVAPAHDGFPPRETSLLKEKLKEARSEATGLDCAESVVFNASKSRARAFADSQHAGVDLDKRSTQDEWGSSIFSRGVDRERMPRERGIGESECGVEKCTRV
jgi:hypothetical protein